jgi:hypothetical protein
MKRYTDTISGEELYIRINRYSNKYYFKDQARTILHRHDGPAVEWSDGYEEWYVDGKLHRLDGPAVEWPDGDKEWYVNDVFIMELDRDGKIVKRME